MRKRFLISFLIFVAGFIFWNSGFAKDKNEVEVVVTGEAAIYNGDKIQAKDKAVEAALRNAVEQAVGTFVSSETMVQNYEVLSDKIYSHAKGYVKHYKILETSDDGKAVTVKIKAVVSTKKLEGDIEAIKILLRRMEKPRVLVMIAEKNVGQEGFVCWWCSGGNTLDVNITENTIIDYFSKKGFHMVDRRIQVTNAVANIDNSQAKKIADQTDAEVVIVGKAVANDAGVVAGTQMHSGQANISVRVLKVDNGDIIATSNAHGAFIHIDPATAGTKALEKAAKKLSEDLMKKILDAWQAQTSGVNKVVLVIKGIRKYAYLSKLKNALVNQIRGVADVVERSMKNGVARLQVELKGSTRDLATELSSKGLGGYKVKIDEVTQDTLAITISK